jgi:hypothetical protein
MAKKHSGGIVVATGLKIESQSPLDDRLVVDTLSDLTNPTSLPNIYGGIVVAIANNNYQLYRWNGNDRTNLDNWILLAQADAEPVTFRGRKKIEGELVVQPSSDFPGNLTVSNTIFTDVISSSKSEINQLTLKKEGDVNLLTVTSESNTPIAINPSGILVMDNYQYTPPAVEGGLLYSGSEFYIGSTDS